MRFVLKSFLILSVVLTYLLFLAVISIRFQLLEADFWKKSLSESDIYEKADDILKTEIEKEFPDQGLSDQESQKISDFLKKETIEEISTKNIDNIFNFINKESDNLFLYFPKDKLPDEIKLDLDIVSDQISVSKLISAYGRSSAPVSEGFFEQLRILGNIVTIILISSLVFLGIYLLILYKLELSGTRLKAIALSLILSGFWGFAICLFLRLYIQSAIKNPGGKEALKVFIDSVLPTVVYKLTNFWMIISVATSFLGMLVLFKRK